MRLTSFSPETIELFRWTALGLVLLTFAGFVFLFVRKGSKIKSDADTKPPPDLTPLP
jgi:hypothetical protein